MVSLVLLAILTIGVVSAAEDNATSDDLTVSEDSIVESVDDVKTNTVSDDIQETVNDDAVEQSQDNDILSEKKDANLSFDMPSRISITDDDWYGLDELYGCKADSGIIQFWIDDEVYYESDELYWPFIEVSADSFSKLSYGMHNWKLNYSGNSKFNPDSINGTFEYAFMDLNFPQYVTYDSFSVRLPYDAQGDIILYVNGKKVSTTKYEIDEWDQCSIPIKGCSEYGNYTYRVVYSGDSKYPEYALDGVFEYSFMRFDYDGEIEYGTTSYLDVYLPEDISGNIEIYINGKRYKKVPAQEDMHFDIGEFNVGDNEVTLKYTGSKKYPARSYSYLVTTAPNIHVDRSVAFTDPLEVSLLLPSDAKGTLIAVLNGEVRESKFTDGKAVIEFSGFLFDTDYNLVVYYNGTDYEVEKNEGGITVLPKIILPDFAEGIKYVSFELPSDATGNLRILLDDDDLDVNFENGKAKVDLSKILEYECLYYFQIIYSGNYPAFNEEFDIDMQKPIPEINVSIPSSVIVGNTANIVFNLPKDANGGFEIYDSKYDIEGSAGASNGKATAKIVFPRTGTVTLYYDYESDDNYQDVRGNFTVTVLPQGKITASALTMSYSDGSTYKVRVFDSNGKPVTAGKKVTFKINGKTVKSVKTDKNGYASFKPNQLPGSYKITTVASGAKVTKTLKVKRILSLKTVKVKKSAKKLVFQANLAKVKGKFLKNKQITFKFNGKKIGTAKTNAKGVAKLTIKSTALKNLLKKLKVGKKVAYQAIYIKDTVKKTAKVAK